MRLFDACASQCAEGLHFSAFHSIILDETQPLIIREKVDDGKCNSTKLTTNNVLFFQPQMTVDAANLFAIKLFAVYALVATNSYAGKAVDVVVKRR